MRQSQQREPHRRTGEQVGRADRDKAVATEGGHTERAQVITFHLHSPRGYEDAELTDGLQDGDGDGEPWPGIGERVAHRQRRLARRERCRRHQAAIARHHHVLAPHSGQWRNADGADGRCDPHGTRRHRLSNVSLRPLVAHDDGLDQRYLARSHVDLGQDEIAADQPHTGGIMGHVEDFDVGSANGDLTGCRRVDVTGGKHHRPDVLNPAERHRRLVEVSRSNTQPRKLEAPR